MALACGKTFSFIKTLWFFVSLCICLYIIGERVVYYFSNPITTHSELIDKTTVQFPTVLFCRHAFSAHFGVAFLQEIISKCKLDTECKDLSLDDIKQYPLKKLGLSVVKYWDDYGITSNLLNNVVYCKFMTNPPKDCKGEHSVEANKTLKRTILGTCTEHQLDAEFNFYGYYTYLTINVKAPLEFLSISDSLDDVWLFLPDDEDYSLHEVFYFVRTIPKNVQIQGLLTRQNFHLLSTKATPCLKSLKSRGNCMDQCFNDFILPNLTCRLPFYSEANIPICSTYEETVKMYSRLYEIYESRATNYCQCHKLCEHTRIKAQITLEGKGLTYPNYSSSISFRFSSNSIHTISHRFVYPFSALVSDIGGSIGFFLGISIFTSFDMMKHVFTILIDKVKDKKSSQVIKLNAIKNKPNFTVSNYHFSSRRISNHNVR